MKPSADEDKRIQAVKEATSFLFHKHYCENDVEAIIDLFDDKLSWIGAGENEYDVGTEKVSGIFRQFTGMVPKCNIWNEEYHVIDISPDVYICTGRAWIATDPSTSIYLCVHHRCLSLGRRHPPLLPHSYLQSVFRDDTGGCGISDTDGAAHI